MEDSYQKIEDMMRSIGLTVGDWVDPRGSPIQNDTCDTGPVFKVTKAENGIIEMELIEGEE